MKDSKIHELVIKNMICSRCLKVVRQDLESIGIEVLELQLGRLKIRFLKKDITLEEIQRALKEDDFEIASSKDEIIIEEIKLLLVNLVNNLPITINKQMSNFLSQKLGKDYWTLSKTFSKSEGTTIERYYILLRIEKVKELIEYENLNFSEIAFELGYNNISHLSRQFKQVTNMSMSEYKGLKGKSRIPLNKIL